MKFSICNLLIQVNWLDKDNSRFGYLEIRHNQTYRVLALYRVEIVLTRKYCQQF
jgi:hypothetical protein